MHPNDLIKNNSSERGFPQPAYDVPPAPAIELEHVWLYFEDKAALTDVSFNVDQDEMLVMMGASGSGKSVILKLILGLIKSDSGKILVEGQDLEPIPEKDLRHI